MISEKDKNKLKNFLGNDLVEAAEKRDLDDVKENISKIETTIAESMQVGLKDLERKISRIKNTDLTPVIDALNKFADSIMKTNKPQDMSGFFKDMSVQIGQSGTSSKNTEDLIRNLKWNSSMQIRPRSGGPISPQIQPFYISDYDDIQLSSYDANGNPGIVNYYLGAGLIATLTLTYDGSGNLTEAKRTA